MTITTHARWIAAALGAAAVAAPAAQATDDGTLLTRASHRPAKTVGSGPQLSGARHKSTQRSERAARVAEQAYRAAYEAYRHQLGLPPLPLLEPGSYIGHPGGPVGTYSETR